MMGLVSFVALSIACFASRYLQGDRKKVAFYINMTILVIFVFLMVNADHILLFIASWALSNYFLTRLMRHKHGWEAAKHSSLLALSNFALGALFLGSALFILFLTTGKTSIQQMLNAHNNAPWMVLSSMLILLAAMTQSALWPFHRWLISSLNSPTPASAMMHAGLVNGGGIILIRFAPLLSTQSAVLNIIFVIGLVTALLGTLWKLMQHDVKRMLACSTMGQMGFMVAQCGLGLFPAAVAHLCWHGLFKAYLFLGASGSAQEKRLDLDYPPSIRHFAIALILGTFSAYLFSLSSGIPILITDTRCFLILLAMLTGTQLALPIIREHAIKQAPLSLFAAASVGIIYGTGVRLSENILAPLGISHPQPLNTFHIIALLLLTVSWLAILFGRRPKYRQYSNHLLKLYVRMLNASQPHPKTITTHRNEYQY